MNSKKEIFLKGISIQSITTMLMGVLEIIVFAVMSRLLSKDDFGYFAVLTGIMTISTCITEAGLGASVIHKKNASKTFVSTAFTLGLLFGFLGMLTIFIVSPYIAILMADKSITIPLRAMSVNIFLACTSSLGRSILIKQLHFSQIGFISIASYACSSIIGIATAFMGFGMWSVVWISILNLFFFNVLLYTRYIHLPQLHICRKEVHSIISYGGWLTMGVIVNNITQQMDRLFLSKWISVPVLGAYNRPAGFVSNITTKVNGIFDTVLFPMLSNIQNDHNKIQGVFTHAIQLLNSFAIVLFAIFFFNAEFIIRIFFGSNWLELVPILQVISFLAIFNTDNRLVDCFFRSLGYVKLGFRLRIFSALITFISLYFGAKFGILGVAVSLVAANVFTVILKVIFLSIKVNVKLRNVFVAWIQAEKPLLPLLIIGIPFLIFTTHSLMEQIFFAIGMGALIILEFIFFPSLVSKEYQISLYPIVTKFKNNIIQRLYMQK